ncbi:hypothetical protein BH09PSE1_BH09PSE1_08060 [soil metagenome]
MFELNVTPRHKHPGTRRAAVAYAAITVLSLGLWIGALSVIG